MKDEKKQEKKPNKFAAAMRAVFVHNIGWKVLAIVSAAVLWALSAGLY